jgi:hypothetical protein
MSRDEMFKEVSKQLLDDIERWSSELQAGMRSTLWYGVFTKAQQQVGVLLKGCASTFVWEAGDAGLDAVAALGRGKPLERMTMGDNVKLIKKLRPDLLSPADRRLLDRMTGLRNEFEHETLSREQGPAMTAEFLRLAQGLCRSRLLAAVAATASKMGSTPAMDRGGPT